MSDVKYKFCTARQTDEKLSDFSNVPVVKGLLIKCLSDIMDYLLIEENNTNFHGIDT